MQRKPAFQTERSDLRCELDDDDGIGEPTNLFRTVPMSANDQEGDARNEPQEKADHIRPATLSEGLQIVILRLS
jgi:hypothetical protein